MSGAKRIAPDLGGNRMPFMHPFHGDDFYRYSPAGLRRMLKDFELIAFESPLWVFTVVGLALVETLKRAHLGFTEAPIKALCGALDRLFTGRQKRPASFASAYRIVACKPDTTAQTAERFRTVEAS
jgi:hypothetical protein